MARAGSATSRALRTGAPAAQASERRRPLRAAGALFKEALVDFQRDNAPRLGAALAYYTLFSVAPLLIVAIAVAGLLFGEDAARGQVMAELSGLLGETAAMTIEEMLENSRRPGTGILAGVVALLTLFLGATGAFNELKGALNIVWNVPPDAQRRGFFGMLRDRFASFAMVLAVGFLLIVSLAVNAWLAAAHSWLERLFGESAWLLQAFNTALSIATITVLFALIYKYLPDTHIDWNDVWVGAAITSVLFTLGKYLIGLYLGRSSVASVYGAAGSVVVLIVWVYYAAQIFFLGAELTQAYARRHGSRSRR
jgi:membrane protein